MAIASRLSDAWSGSPDVAGAVVSGTASGDWTLSCVRGQIRSVTFVFEDGTLVTPPLSDSILPGITRDSVITLAREAGLTVKEEPYTIDAWRADVREGRLTEAFACGTAAVITPIGTVKGREESFTIGNGKAGPVAQRLRSLLVDIQRGNSNDAHGWFQKIF